MSPPRKRRKVAATPSNSDDESMRGLEYNPVVTTPRKIFIRRRSPPNPGAREVIEISSSDEDSHGPLTPSATTQRALENQREIIEISSDEDDDPQQPTTVSRLAPKLPSLQRDIIEISSDEELASPRRRLYRKWSSTHDDSKVEGNPLSSDNGSEPDARNSDDESEKSDGALSVASPRWRIYRKRSSSNHDDPKIQEDSPSGLDGGSDPDSRNSGEESEKSDGALSAAGPQRRIYRKRSLSNQVSSRLGSDDDDDRVEPDTRDSDTDAAEAKAAIEIWRYKNRTPRQHFDVFLDCVVQLVLDRKFLSKLYEDDEYYSTAIIALRRDNDIHASQIAKATWKPPFVAALDLRHLLRGNQQDSDSDSDSDFDLDFDLDFEEDDSDSSGDEQGDEGREQDDQTEDSDSSRDDRDPKADYYRSACHACWTRGRYYCSYDGFLQLWTKRGMYNPDTFQVIFYLHGAPILTTHTETTGEKHQVQQEDRLQEQR
ncbi:hypothetical protein C8J57DRAFT_264145 [Mycena rebaudengoi]|nr:hypothetical protein C8J57DRAFT_264145 [Mycena rebaudengoi]